MELRDLYDAERNLLGKAIRPDEKVPEGAYVVCVGMWVVNSRREILLTRRAPEKRFAPGKWENPAAVSVLRSIWTSWNGMAVRKNNLMWIRSCSTMRMPDRRILPEPCRC